ncbi:MAG: response regulator [Anaerolineae bacterium]|nr:response regulator [Anaerolineae bacterium]
MTGPLVLIVDDELGLLDLFAGLLERTNCRVMTASSGSMALETLSQHTPDLMILDLAMPGMDGFEVLQAVRTVRRLDAMKVMILTARPNLVPEVEPLGIDGWVAKPLLPHEFRSIVHAMLTS